MAICPIQPLVSNLTKSQSHSCNICIDAACEISQGHKFVRDCELLSKKWQKKAKVHDSTAERAHKRSAERFTEEFSPTRIGSTTAEREREVRWPEQTVNWALKGSFITWYQKDLAETLKRLWRSNSACCCCRRRRCKRHWRAREATGDCHYNPTLHTGIVISTSQHL